MTQQAMQTAALLVRALWGSAMGVIPMPAPGGIDTAVLQPLLDREAEPMPMLYLPPAEVPGKSVAHSKVLASAAHAAAHLRFSPAGCDAAGIKPLTQTIMGLLEDARVEALAMEEISGLRSLWQPFHDACAVDDATLEGLLRRLARALFEPSSHDIHPWVVKGKALYRDACRAGWSEMRVAASILGNDIAQMRIRFNPAVRRGQPAYRDDNRHLWCMPSAPAASASDSTVENASHQGRASPSQSTEQKEAASTLRPLGTVPEWDRWSSHYRQDWCALFEMPPRAGNPAALENFLRQQAAWVQECTRRLRQSDNVRGRPVHASAGADFDEPALVDAGVAWRAGSVPDPRIYLQAESRFAPRHVVFILDASASTAGKELPWLHLHQATLLQGMAAATMLACVALERSGHACSIIGFNSNTRQCVRILPVKEEGERVSSQPVLARLAGLKPEWSTRSGAAVRHALPMLEGKEDSLIVLVTDGEPHDIDLHDPLYLPEDLRRAAQEADRRGVTLVSLELTHARTGHSGRFGPLGRQHRPVSSLHGLTDALLAALRQGA